jgi:acyl-CoA synthetase (AMP-forming)/AMP-acid ligase II
VSRPVFSWIEHHAQRIPDRVALIDLHRGRETTYGELTARVRSLAWSLHERGKVLKGPLRAAAVLPGQDRAHA